MKKNKEFIVGLLILVAIVIAVFVTERPTAIEIDPLIKENKEIQERIDSLIFVLNNDISNEKDTIFERFHEIVYIEKENKSNAKKHFYDNDTNVYNEYIRLLSILKSRLDTSSFK